MEPTTIEQTPASPTHEVEEKLSRYWGLMDRHDALAERIQRAEAEKGSVSQRIYEKVRGDYEHELNGVLDALEPLKQELEALRRTHETRIEEIALSLKEIEDELAEATFRHRIGEFKEDAFRQTEASIAPRLQKKADEKAVIEAIIASFDRRKRPAGETPVEPARPADSSPPKPADPAAPVAPEAPFVGFENPMDWMMESPHSPGSSRGARRQQPAVATVEEEDPLAALADPSSEASRPQAAAGNESAEFPSLVIMNGRAQGKLIPLLPMTTSIGREHDNNIELKDPEVARYHARIIYESGKFSVEDLESLSGVFVNGAKTRRAALAHGDMIRVGSTELRYGGE